MKQKKYEYETSETSNAKFELLATFVLGTITIFVRRGTRQNLKKDIVVSFIDSSVKDTKEKRIKHIYWAVDVLLKREHEPHLVKEYLDYFSKQWETVDVLKSNSKEDFAEWVSINLNKRDLSKFKCLSQYGFLSIEALEEILSLILVQEKSNGEGKAFMFITVVRRIADFDVDLYDVISWADTNKGAIKWENKK